MSDSEQTDTTTTTENGSSPASDAAGVMRLWVVGEDSPNPADWSQWSEWALVLARNEDEARAVSDRPYEPVTEIPIEEIGEPLCLASMSEPNMGRDI